MFLLFVSRKGVNISCNITKRDTGRQRNWDKVSKGKQREGNYTRYCPLIEEQLIYTR